MEKKITLAFMILVGLFCIFCAVKDYDWFMNNRKAWLFVKIFGRNGARIAYIIIGVLILILSIIAYFRI